MNVKAVDQLSCNTISDGGSQQILATVQLVARLDHTFSITPEQARDSRYVQRSVE